jgi:hypothetical protein
MFFKYIFREDKRHVFALKTGFAALFYPIFGPKCPFVGTVLAK